MPIFPTLPLKDIEQPRRLAELCGSLWSGDYAGQDAVQGFLGGFGRAVRQADQNLQEASLAVSRLRTPLRHTHLWRLLTFLESDLIAGDESLPRYGEGYVYASRDTPIFYGLPVRRQAYWLNLPAGITAIAGLYNRLSDPSVALLSGIDYAIDTTLGVIKLIDNPFANPLWAVRNVYSGGEIVDRELLMWAQAVETDDNLVYDHHGHVLRVPGPATENYRRLINALWDGAVLGSSVEVLCDLLGAIADVPVVEEASETVEAIWRQADALVVATDKNVYRAPPASQTTLAVGDQLSRGNYVTTAIRIYEINRGELPAELDWISVEPRFLGADYRGSLMFHNSLQATTITSRDGKTVLEFPVTGDIPDVRKFWDSVHADGLAAGLTLAEALDSRTSPNGQPTAAYLPTSVNPAAFLVANVFRSNLVIIRMDSSQFGAESLTLSRLSRVRDILPPHVGVLIEVLTTLPTGVVPVTGDVPEGPFLSVNPTTWRRMPYALSLDLAAAITGDAASTYDTELCA